MEINEQLLEDILSGKLKGTFVTRNGWKIDSNMICRNTDDYYSSEHEKYCYPYMHVKNHAKTYTISGRINELYTYHFDIVDFIPDTDMKENELTIELPERKIVDWEESQKQNKIVLKDKQLTYKDVCKQLFNGKNVYYIHLQGDISSIPFSELDVTDVNNALSSHQLECILAKNKLANVAKYLNDGWKPEKRSYIYVINNYRGNLVVYTYKEECSVRNGQVIFKTEELAHQAVKILGEETVKLALEPLGI